MGKDCRTPEAQKWPSEYLPPETSGSIDAIQNDLEHLRDANSQLRHAARAAIARAEALREGLRAADDALAQVTAFESDARYIMGNTNYEIVKLRREQIRAALNPDKGSI